MIVQFSRSVVSPKFVLIGQSWSCQKSQSSPFFPPGQDHIASSLFNCQHQWPILIPKVQGQNHSAAGPAGKSPAVVSAVGGTAWRAADSRANRRVGRTRTGSYKPSCTPHDLQNGLLPKASPLWASVFSSVKWESHTLLIENWNNAQQTFLWAWEKEFSEQTPPLPPNIAATMRSQENQIRVLILPIICWRRKVSGAQAPYGKPHLQGPEGGAEMKEDTVCEQAPQTVNSSSTRWEEL